MTGLQRVVYSFFSSRGRKVVREMLVTMCAGDPHVLTHVRLQRVILRTEKYISELPFFYFFLFKLVLYLFEYALPPLSWKIRPFTRMNLDRRLEYLEEWQSSGFYFKRVLLKMIQCICVANLYSERRLLISIGFEASLKNRASHTLSIGGHAAP